MSTGTSAGATVTQLEDASLTAAQTTELVVSSHVPAMYDVGWTVASSAPSRAALVTVMVE